MSNPRCTPPTPDVTPPRRDFLSAAAATVCGGCVAVLPLIPGIGPLLDPILRKKKEESTAGDGFLRVASINSIPADGTPVAIPIKMDKWDAWTFEKDVPVGSIYLRKLPDGGLECFNSRCPHLGCKVNFHAASQSYLCPCHASGFDVTGKMLNQIPPRGLDSLEFRVEGQDIFVKFQDFETGETTKIPS